jgi:hypothetical protein
MWDLVDLASAEIYHSIMLDLRFRLAVFDVNRSPERPVRALSAPEYIFSQVTGRFLKNNQPDRPTLNLYVSNPSSIVYGLAILDSGRCSYIKGR